MAQKKPDLSLISFDDLFAEMSSRFDATICAAVGRDGDENKLSFKFLGNMMDGLALCVLLQRYVEGYACAEAQPDQEGLNGSSDTDKG